MALHPNFPTDPHVILDPSIRWFPADESYRDRRADQLIPPLVAQLRKEVKAWRETNYDGATETSKSLLRWWFETEHIQANADGTDRQFQYFFAQREAVETIVFLTDIVKAKDKFDLMRYDSSGLVSAKMFDETWLRYVVKMATGAGKTKVLSLVLAWAFFHKTYEEESTLARNFLVIAPNIIVLDRIRKDFDGLRIFFHDPVLPDDGYEGRDWRSDFQLTLHVQDDVRIVRKTGNIFLTNIHRVYAGNETIPSADDEDTMDYFLGTKPSGKTNDSNVDLGMIVRDIDELVILNDEAHHIHDPKMAWFKSIEDIHNRLIQKDGLLSMQVDVTATPRHNNGAIFVQTVSDYPLVEAIRQNVVKHPVIPDGASRSKLQKRTSVKFTEKYADYLHLGVVEWRKDVEQHEKQGKKAILFVMTDDTKNCDDVKTYLEAMYPELAGAVLVIHTKNNGEISEASSGKNKEELEELRRLANNIDGQDNKYKVIVSVLMLKEGWDVRNVTTIVGLRSYSAKSNILPEQTLGRGLRKMYLGRVEETVSVIGTEAFMEFVESIRSEGVDLVQRPMGEGAKPNMPVLVEIDSENDKKDLDELDIEIPVMTPRIYREYKNLDLLDPSQFGNDKIPIQQFTEEQQREIIFRDITDGKISHTTLIETAGVADYRSIVGFYAQSIMKEMRLVSGYDVLYRKVKTFLQENLFENEVNLEDANVMRNLSELNATKTTYDTFRSQINALTVLDKGNAEIRDRIKLRNTRPFVAKEQSFYIPKHSIFNRIIGDGGFELEFATFLDKCAGNGEIVSFAKNYMSIGFKLDYVTANGAISNYIPDFFVKVNSKRIVIIETKGMQEIDLPQKMARLKQWCEDLNAAQKDVVYEMIFVDQASYHKHNPKSFVELEESFREYR